MAIGRKKQGINHTRKILKTDYLSAFNAATPYLLKIDELILTRPELIKCFTFEKCVYKTI